MGGWLAGGRLLSRVDSSASDSDDQGGGKADIVYSVETDLTHSLAL